MGWWQEKPRYDDRLGATAVLTPPVGLGKFTRSASIPMHILLVAPEGPWRGQMATFLEDRGFRVICASSVEDALDYQGPLRFALVALDLPDRPGWQLWNRLATDERTPLALFWGDDPSRWERLSVRANHRTAFLQSPFGPKDLLRALVELEQYRVNRI